MGVRKIEVPTDGWFIRENPKKGMIWGYPYFRKTPYVAISQYHDWCHMEFSINAGYPIAWWFISWKIPNKHVWFGVASWLRKPPTPLLFHISFALPFFIPPWPPTCLFQADRLRFEIEFLLSRGEVPARGQGREVPTGDDSGQYGGWSRNQQLAYFSVKATGEW